MHMADVVCQTCLFVRSGKHWVSTTPHSWCAAKHSPNLPKTPKMHLITTLDIESKLQTKAVWFHSKSTLILLLFKSWKVKGTIFGLSLAFKLKKVSLEIQRRANFVFFRSNVNTTLFGKTVVQMEGYVLCSTDFSGLACGELACCVLNSSRCWLISSRRPSRSINCNRSRFWAKLLSIYVNSHFPTCQRQKYVAWNLFKAC